MAEALKNGGLEKKLINLGLNVGIGSKGELTQEQLNVAINYDEDDECQNIEENVRQANQSLEASLPGVLLNSIEWIV